VRRRRKILIRAAVCFLLVFAFVQWTRRLPSAASEALENADRYELLSLDPRLQIPATPGLFHGFRVLGQTVVSDSGKRRELNRALHRGAKSMFANLPRCFNPRHGIRVTRAGRTTDFLICFECQQVEVRVGDQLVADWLTDDSPQPEFDQVLPQAGVPLATGPSE
jgi:hypothetical protein